jgi:hypothetical protein
MMEDLLGD